MTALEKIRNWLDTYPGIDKLQGLKVDYYAAQPENSTIAPAGLVEISRKPDILGNVIVENQYNFALYFVFLKAPDDDVGATENADWLMDFQNWVQEQSILKKVPVFGDIPETETVKAQNGSIADATLDGTALYMVQLSINFTKKYEVN